ncbi:hypothetical protein IQ273_17455 [Nodosilinea sp. LEGE 07298]|uniref:hypothetical protein n=1 Tax=Nodosilinea sp. LEGE 07298 TaxID=2777970 RepID=UPI0018827E4E|nr:hypothetical protein [Nodosilinea sp. LEGE 07298]MBE9111195.1 hypothetical protein [Nodosilinea sp. LEGE 07298]
MELDLSFLVTRQESDSTLVRFEDATDANAPRLNYAIPLPGAFQGKLYVETDFLNDSLPWTSAARAARPKRPAIRDFVTALENGNMLATPPVENLVVFPTVPEVRLAANAVRLAPILRSTVLASGSLPGRADAPSPRDPTTGIGGITVRPARDPVTGTGGITVQPLGSGNAGPEIILTSHASLGLVLGDREIDIAQIAAEERDGNVPVLYQRFGGDFGLTYVPEPEDPADANPRFVVIEHYRLSSFFGDYGAGRTLANFSLMPGEETSIYLRTFRRSETTSKEASSIFDSFTTEAANEFESDLMSETTNTESESAARTLESKYKGSGEINIGIAKTSHSGERNVTRETASARESVAKNVAKTTSKHASKASSKRDVEVTQELEQTEEQEFERIVERKIKNTNLSRTLNIVTRELNQEFATYFSLYDITIAFVNDTGIFEVFQVHQIDDMIEKYIAETSQGGLVDPNSPFGAQTPRTFMRERLLEQVNVVYDVEGTRHDFLEEVSIEGGTETVGPVGTVPAGGTRYLRVRRPRGPERENPFYEPGRYPVDGIVMDVTRHTVRTPAVIIDALLGHGVALDNYALGLQQETLREKQLENNKTELALALIDAGDADRLEAFRSLFGGPDITLLQEIATGGE